MGSCGSPREAQILKSCWSLFNLRAYKSILVKNHETNYKGFGILSSHISCVGSRDSVYIFEAFMLSFPRPFRRDRGNNRARMALSILVRLASFRREPLSTPILPEEYSWLRSILFCYPTEIMETTAQASHHDSSVSRRNVVKQNALWASQNDPS